MLLFYVYILLICMSFTQAFRSTRAVIRQNIQRKMTSTSIDNSCLVLPELVVFDLDMCLWSPEMYTLDSVPTLKDAQRGKLGDKGDGVVAVSSGYEDIRIFPAALIVLQDFYEGKYGSKMRIAAASSADTPRAVSIGRAAMGILEGDISSNLTYPEFKISPYRTLLSFHIEIYFLLDTTF